MTWCFYAQTHERTSLTTDGAPRIERAAGAIVARSARDLRWRRGARRTVVPGAAVTRGRAQTRRIAIEPGRAKQVVGHTV